MLKYPCTQFFPWKFTTTSNLNTFYIPSMHSYDSWIYMYLNFLHALHLELFKFLRAIVMTWPKFRHLDSWTVLIKTEFWWKWFVKALSLTKSQVQYKWTILWISPFNLFLFSFRKICHVPKVILIKWSNSKTSFHPPCWEHCCAIPSDDSFQANIGSPGPASRVLRRPPSQAVWTPWWYAGLLCIVSLVHPIQGGQLWSLLSGLIGVLTYVSFLTYFKSLW